MNIQHAHISVPNHVGWRYYSIIRKKAMEQEFSWSGLIISLSIAFLIVLTCAFSLRAIHQSITAQAELPEYASPKIYQLESAQYINVDKDDTINNLLFNVV